MNKMLLGLACTLPKDDDREHGFEISSIRIVGR